MGVCLSLSLYCSLIWVWKSIELGFLSLVTLPVLSLLCMWQCAKTCVLFAWMLVEEDMGEPWSQEFAPSITHLFQRAVWGQPSVPTVTLVQVTVNNSHLYHQHCSLVILIDIPQNCCGRDWTIGLALGKKHSGGGEGTGDSTASRYSTIATALLAPHKLTQ